MARAILTDAERLAWESFPAVPDPDVIGAFFTLADGEVDALRRLPAPASRLAGAVALAAIRWLGFVPAELDQAPAAGRRAARRPARRRPGCARRVRRLGAHSTRAPPACRAAGAVSRRSWRGPRRSGGSAGRAGTRVRLAARSAAHRGPCAARRPAAAPGVVDARAAGSRPPARAERETFQRLDPLLDGATRRALDALCVTDVRLGVSRLVWLGREATYEQLRQHAWQQMPPERWAAARERARQLLRSLDDNHFEQLAGKYPQLRRFAPPLARRAALPRRPRRPVAAGRDRAAARAQRGRRTLPPAAPTGFVPARWRPHVIDADGRLERRRWKLCLLIG